MPWKMASYLPNFLKCFDFCNLSENLNVICKSNSGWEVMHWNRGDKDGAVQVKSLNCRWLSSLLCLMKTLNHDALRYFICKELQGFVKFLWAKTWDTCLQMDFQGARSGFYNWNKHTLYI